MHPIRQWLIQHAGVQSIIQQILLLEARRHRHNVGRQEYATAVLAAYAGAATATAIVSACAAAAAAVVAADEPIATAANS